MAGLVVEVAGGRALYRLGYPLAEVVVRVGAGTRTGGQGGQPPSEVVGIALLPVAGDGPHFVVAVAPGRQRALGGEQAVGQRCAGGVGGSVAGRPDAEQGAVARQIVGVAAAESCRVQ